MKFILSCLFGILFSAIIFSSCSEPVAYTPKPRAYPKIVFPEKAYQAFDKDYCQFSFEYPTYVNVIQDTLFFDEKPSNPCWFDLQVPDLNATIHCSYIEVGKEETFDKIISDAYALTNKHNVRADYIESIPIQKPNNVSGYLFDVQGSVASPFQFYLTDSTTHFLRASLYVKDKAQPDSLAPIYEFLKQDMVHMINTFEWEDGE